MSILGHNRRFTPVAVRLRRLATIIGAALLAGSASVAAVTAVPATPASADTAPYTAACTSGFLGSFTAASIATTGTLSASPVAPGGSETLNNYGLVITIPASVVNAAIANGVTSLTGSIATSIDATNITIVNASIPAPAKWLRINIEATKVTKARIRSSIPASCFFAKHTTGAGARDP